MIALLLLFAAPPPPFVFDVLLFLCFIGPLRENPRIRTRVYPWQHGLYLHLSRTRGYAQPDFTFEVACPRFHLRLVNRYV